MTTTAYEQTRVAVRAMTAAEFTAACRRHAWRPAAATDATARTAPPIPRTEVETRQSASTSSAARPPPPAPPMTARDGVLAMTDAEFAKACREHRWRVGTPSR